MGKQISSNKIDSAMFYTNKTAFKAQQVIVNKKKIMKNRA
jgi:hypothetical protein